MCSVEFDLNMEKGPWHDFNSELFMKGECWLCGGHNGSQMVFRRFLCSSPLHTFSFELGEKNEMGVKFNPRQTKLDLS